VCVRVRVCMRKGAGGGGSGVRKWTPGVVLCVL